METFELSRLTDFDFEAVCKDIFEEEFGVRLEIFATGADAGVDLRHFQANESALIVQCKHWSRSTRAKLIEHVEKSEAPKVARLKPQRYVLATSLTLTKSAKDKLFAILQPYVLSANDIYGKDELDALLRKHEHIVRRHLRLWLTSASVLNSLLAKKIVTRSQGLVREIERTLVTYAANPSLGKALEILEAGHVCVIAGVPGVGKTTLGNVLCAHFLSAGYELIEISEDVDEANQLWDDEVKQVYYYDDFLGQTTLAEKLGKNEDGRLLSLMKRVSCSPDKRFILTTREYILEQAKQRYERLDRHSFDVQTCVIDLTEYTFRAKASILYNHIYSSTLSREIKASFADPEVYLPIVEHRNFNPRIVAASLSEAELLSDRPEDLPVEIIRNFNNPHRLWEHIVENQLGEIERKLLMVILSFLSELQVGELEKMWAGYGESLRELKKALRVLDGTMLKSSELKRKAYVGFHNPSVRDYLAYRVRLDVSELRSLISLAQTFEQIETLWFLFPVRGGGKMLPTYRDCKRELEEAAARAFRSEPVDLQGHSTSWINFARRAWVFLEMGKYLQSPVIRDMGLKALAHEKSECSAEDKSDFSALFQVLSGDDTAEGRQALSDVVASAIEWAMGDLSDWSLIREAEELMETVRHYAPMSEVEEAFYKLAEVRDEYADDRFEDWSQRFREPRSSASEMKDIIEYYSSMEDAPYFAGFEAAEEKIADFDFDHLSAFSRSTGRESKRHAGWSEKLHIASMMRTLGGEG